MSEDYIHYVDTLFGFKPLSKLGVTLVHEHLTSNFLSHKMQKIPKEACDSEEDLCLSNISDIKRYPYFYSKNLCLFDQDVAKIMNDELSLFKRAGGNTIVEKSSYGLERNLPLLKFYSRATGIHVVVGTGYYTATSQPASELSKTSEELYKNMLEEFSGGIKVCNDVYPAFIGAVGVSCPIHDFERKSIIATGEVQAQLHCPVSFSLVNFNPNVCNDCPLWEIIRIYEEAGGYSRKAIMSHVQHIVTDKEELMQFVDLTGCFIQFDSFGDENSIYYQDNQFFEVPSDAQCLDFISQLKKENELDRVLISHNIHTKNKLVSYGGQGYSHILRNIVPRMLKKDFKFHEIEQILIENPQNWLHWL